MMLNLPNKLERFRHRESETGFSMLELVIAVVILGILAAIAIPIYNAQTKEATLAALKSDVTHTAQNVSLKTAKANEEQNFIFNPCTPVGTFNSTLRVQSDTRNNITCLYYGSAVARTGAEKRQAYNTYEWCVQGVRTDLGETWNYNSRNMTVKSGACARIGGVSNEEAIG